MLEPGLVIHSIYNGYWFWGRPSFYELWRDLRAATAEIRPDLDLSIPGLLQGKLSQRVEGALIRSPEVPRPVGASEKRSCGTGSGRLLRRSSSSV